MARRDGRRNPSPTKGRADGQFLRNLWAAADQTGSDIRLIVSWHELIENSHIEPSVRYGPVPGSDQTGEGRMEACLERSNPVPQDWVLHVHVRSGDWVEDRITISKE